MSKTLTCKAVAFEHSKGENYNLGQGVVFSNSIKQAIKAAKHKTPFLPHVFRPNSFFTDFPLKANS